MTQPTDPIFVVGASRSGTALMRSLLNNDPTIFIAGETHYFDDLRPRMRGKERRLEDEDDARACEDYFLALTHRPYGHGGDPSKARLPRERLRDEAAHHGGGADGYFEAYCAIMAAEEGKTRWGEKTPRHVYRIPEILDRYPDARIIVMIRDPRAVVASYRDWRNQGGFDLDADPGHEQAVMDDERRARQSYNIVMQSLLWRSTVNAALEAQERLGAHRVRMVRYEDLVDDPSAAVGSLCAWLDIPETPELLQVPTLNSSFARFDPHGGIRTEARERWRQKLDAEEVLVIQTTCHAAMAAAGYRPDPVERSWLALGRAYASVVPAAMRAVLANRQRIASLPLYIWRRLRLLVRRN